MATLPKQVQDQIDESNRIAEELKAMQDAEAQADGSDAEDEVEAPESSVQEGSFEAEAPEVEVLEDSGEAEEDENSDTYKQRWKSLDGMIAAEKRRNAELRGRIESLENMLAQLTELRAQQPHVAAQETAQDKAVATNLSAAEIEEYGADLIEVMKRAARDAVQKDFDALREENAKLKSVIGGVGQKVEMSDREKLYTQLDARVDNWKEINRDPQFLDWLSQLDVYAGQPRRDLLNRAFQANDAMRVARFFEGFLNETAAVSNAASRQQTTEQAPAPSKKVKLDKLAAPGVGASGSADNTSQSSGRMLKESEIGAFYEQARKGHFKGREAEYRKTEQQIQAALSEGRILLGQ